MGQKRSSGIRTLIWVGGVLAGIFALGLILRFTGVIGTEDTGKEIETVTVKLRP